VNVKINHSAETVEGAFDVNLKSVETRYNKLVNQANKDCCSPSEFGDRMQKQDSVDAVLSRKYRGHDSSLWGRLQGLHDNIRYWDVDNGGLSEDGEIEVADIKSRYND